MSVFGSHKTDAELLASNAEFWKKNPNFDVKCMDNIGYSKEDYISTPIREKRRSSPEWARRLSLSQKSEAEGGERDEEYLKRKAKREERWKRQSVKIVDVSSWETMGASEGQGDVGCENANATVQVREEGDDSASREEGKPSNLYETTKVEEDWIIIPELPKADEDLKS